MRTTETRARVPLSGTWSFRLDPQDTGLSEGWQAGADPLPARVEVPGAFQAQGHGDNRHRTPVCQSRGMDPQLVEKTTYAGTAWYRRSFTAPQVPQAGRAWLCLGGVMPAATFWIDGREVGTHDRPLLEGRLDVTELVRPGREQTLTARIWEPAEGRNWGDPLTGGVYSCMTTWSGLYRDLWIETTPCAWIDAVRVSPDLAVGAAGVDVDLRRTPGATVRAPRVRVQVVGPDGAVAGAAEQDVSLAEASADASLSVALDPVRAWTPDDPFLYTARVTLVHAEALLDEATERFGMRSLAVRGNDILLNGRPVFLRGYGDDAVYPGTLSPPLDRATLAREIRQAKDYGFTYVDHLYGLPHREYLDLCDELGFLVQCYPSWTSSSLAQDGRHDERLAHLRAAVGQVYNHASVIAFSFAAEVYHFRADVVDEITRLERRARELDPTRLHFTTGGTSRAAAAREATDVLEMAGDYMNNPADIVAQTKPVVVHEYRWWSSYPDPSLKPKYERAEIAMRPYFIEFAERRAAERGLTDLLPTFVQTTQALQARERKIGIEKARRGRDVRGYAIWMGKDTTAAVEGVWDDFCDPKNVSAETFRRSNGATVLLIDRDYYYRTLWSGERIGVEVWLSHFGDRPVRKGTLSWTLQTPAGRVLAEGARQVGDFPARRTERLTFLSLAPEPVDASTRATLHLTLSAPGVSTANAWDFWIFARNLRQPSGKRVAGTGDIHFVFERAAPESTHEEFDLVVTSKLEERMVDYLESGGRVMVLGSGAFPEFWTEWKSIGWNSSDNATSGTVIADHPALGGFPHDGWCDLQFYSLTEDATVLDLDAWPVRMDPIIRAIDSYKGCRNKAYLVEAAVGRGKLLVCTFNFGVQRGIGRYMPAVENVALFNELLWYALGDGFRPRAQVPAAWLHAIASPSPAAAPKRRSASGGFSFDTVPPPS